jgi:hypothetical protein
MAKADSLLAQTAISKVHERKMFKVTNSAQVLHLFS